MLDFLEVAVRDVDGHELFARRDKIGDKDGWDVTESGIGRAADRVDDGLELGGEGLVATKLERACEQPVVELVVAEERGRALVDEVLELLVHRRFLEDLGSGKQCSLCSSVLHEAPQLRLHVAGQLCKRERLDELDRACECAAPRQRHAHNLDVHRCRRIAFLCCKRCGIKGSALAASHCASALLSPSRKCDNKKKSNERKKVQAKISTSVGHRKDELCVSFRDVAVCCVFRKK